MYSRINATDATTQPLHPLHKLHKKLYSGLLNHPHQERRITTLYPMNPPTTQPSYHDSLAGLSDDSYGSSTSMKKGEKKAKQGKS
jgi:hypothetical protein